jgi:hypothetical protein
LVRASSIPEDITMDVVDLPLEQIIPYARNPRRNEQAIATVAASIQEFGWRQPIVVDEAMVVLAGHTRLEAALSLQATVLIFDRLHLANHGRIHPAILGTPFVERRIAHPMLAAQLGNWHTAFRLTQNRDDLRFSVSACLHS